MFIHIGVFDFDSSATGNAPIIIDDAAVEFTEGFIAFLQVTVSDPRDQSRLTILNDIALVVIQDNGEENKIVHL